MSIRVYLDNCCYNRPYDDQAQLKAEPGTDYTEWRKDKFNGTLDELLDSAVEYAKSNHKQ